MREPSKNNIAKSDSQSDFLSAESLDRLKAYVANSVTQVRAAATISTNENLICQKTFDTYASVHEVDIQTPDNSILLSKILQFLVCSLLSPEQDFLQQQLLDSIQDSSSKSISVIAEITEIVEVVVTEFLKQQSIDEEVIDIVTQTLQSYGNKLIQLQGCSPQGRISNAQVIKKLRSSSLIKSVQLKPKEGLWERGDRMIAMTAGGAFLGGTIGLAPGAIIGATAGAIFALLAKVD